MSENNNENGSTSMNVDANTTTSTNEGSSNSSSNNSQSLRRSRQQFQRGSSQLSLQVVSTPEPDSPDTRHRQDNNSSNASSSSESNPSTDPSSTSNSSPAAPPSPSIEREKRRHTITVSLSPQITRKPSMTSINTPDFSSPLSNPQNASSPSQNQSQNQNQSQTSSSKTLHIYSGVYAIQGRRKHMEDAHTIFNPSSESNSNSNPKSDPSSHTSPTLPETEISSSIASRFPEPPTTPFCFYGVFDGHGGKKASTFAAQHIHLYTLTSPDFPSNPTLAIQNSFSRVESEFLVTAEAHTLSDGTTALTAFILGQKMFVGSVGDSEGVLCRKGKSIALNSPHNPSKNKAEAERVIAAGGRIVDGRVAHPMLNPNLFSIAVSRAIGDVVFKGRQFVGEGKNSGLIADVEVKEVDLKEGEDEFFILACDGLWDVMTHEEAVEFVREKLGEQEKGGKGGESMEEDGENEEGRVEKLSKLLVEKAYKSGSMDNITAMICVLRWE
eukprot:TRINITY_DN2641_c0_g1_i1.p1 TRINITY_DN2641_c0_g1~~TRINITY_DN2641_c0_g1_i1.p1  ORF type:complete len:497 (-),score=173.27 TRINITY_DN2641_c0_g1_i1:63-1553(-)